VSFIFFYNNNNKGTRNNTKQIRTKNGLAIASTYNNGYSVLQREETETITEDMKSIEVTQLLNNETTDEHKFDSQNITEQIDTKQKIYYKSFN